MLAERSGDELHDDRRDADPRRAPAVVQPGAQLDERLHVELEHGGQLGRGLQARDHARRDRPAPAAQRDRPRDRQRGRRGGRRRRRSRPAAQAVTSRSRMRPPGPEPAIVARVVEREAELLRAGPARAARRAAAPARRRLGGAAPVAAAPARRRRRPARRSLPRRGRCSRGTGCRRPRRPPSAAPPAASASYSARVSAISATVVPIGTVSPAGDEAMNPAGALGLDLGVRLVGLELETTPPGSTSSPSSTSHCASRMSSVYAPSLGMITGTAGIGSGRRRGSAGSRDEDELDVVAAAPVAPTPPRRDRAAAPRRRGEAGPAAAWPITSA